MFQKWVCRLILRHGIEKSEDSGQEWGVLDSQMSPYQQDEPLTDVDDESADDGEKADADGLTPTVLEARYLTRKYMCDIHSRQRENNWM